MENAVVIAGVAGLATGAGKTFAEKTWSVGERWVKSRFGDHLEKAQEKAKDNARSFVDKLAAKVERLEAEHEVNSTVINSALEDPSFSALLQRSLLASAQSSSAEKHEILATLVSGRLGSDSESMVALASPLAAEAVSSLTSRQLNALGLSVAFTYYFPNFIGEPPIREEFVRRCDVWFGRKTDPFVGLNLTDFDLDHLEAVSCIQRAGIWESPQIAANWSHGPLQLTQDEFWNMKSASRFLECWNTRLKTLVPTSVGRMIGIYVLNIKTGTPPAFTHWT